MMIAEATMAVRPNKTAQNKMTLCQPLFHHSLAPLAHEGYFDFSYERTNLGLALERPAPSINELFHFLAIQGDGSKIFVRLAPPWKSVISK